MQASEEKNPVRLWTVFTKCVEVWVPKDRSHEYKDGNSFKTIVGYHAISLYLHVTYFELPFRKWYSTETPDRRQK